MSVKVYGGDKPAIKVYEPRQSISFKDQTSEMVHKFQVYSQAIQYGSANLPESLQVDAKIIQEYEGKRDAQNALIISSKNRYESNVEAAEFAEQVKN